MSCNEFNKKSLTPPPLRGWSGGKINCVQEILEMSWNEKKITWGGGVEKLILVSFGLLQATFAQDTYSFEESLYTDFFFYKKWLLWLRL